MTEAATAAAEPPASVEDRTIQIVGEVLVQAADVPISADKLLFYDLKFTSMDVLDLLFRLEDQFGVPIPEGTLYALARGDMDDAAFCRENILTPAGRERLMALLHDSPPAIFPEQIHVQTLPRYCTVGAFVRLLEHKLAERAAACSAS
jgi:acyl carrier protein